jgi:hypothetical protein
MARVAVEGSAVAFCFCLLFLPFALRPSPFALRRRRPLKFDSNFRLEIAFRLSLATQSIPPRNDRRASRLLFFSCRRSASHSLRVCVKSIGLRQGTAFYPGLRRAAVPQPAQNKAASAAQGIFATLPVVSFEISNLKFEIAFRLARHQLFPPKAIDALPPVVFSRRRFVGHGFSRDISLPQKTIPSARRPSRRALSFDRRAQPNHFLAKQSPRPACPFVQS